MRKSVLNTRRQAIPPVFFLVAEIGPEKVAALVEHLSRGGEVPPVVAALYGGSAMPFDGHHRFDAHRILGRTVDAWVVDGRAFDRLSMVHPRAEELVMCDGVPAMEVADRWAAGGSS